MRFTSWYGCEPHNLLLLLWLYVSKLYNSNLLFHIRRVEGRYSSRSVLQRSESPIMLPCSAASAACREMGFSSFIIWVFLGGKIDWILQRKRELTKNPKYSLFFSYDADIVVVFGWYEVCWSFPGTNIFPPKNACFSINLLILLACISI